MCYWFKSFVVLFAVCLIVIECCRRGTTRRSHGTRGTSSGTSPRYSTGEVQYNTAQCSTEQCSRVPFCALWYTGSHMVATAFPQTHGVKAGFILWPFCVVHKLMVRRSDRNQMCCPGFMSDAHRRYTPVCSVAIFILPCEPDNRSELHQLRRQGCMAVSHRRLCWVLERIRRRSE